MGVAGGPLEITDRDTALRGTLADGTPIELDLSTSLVDEDAIVTITGVAAGCEVAHFAEPRTTPDSADLVEYVTRAGLGETSADFNADGAVDFFDIIDVLRAADEGCALAF